MFLIAGVDNYVSGSVPVEATTFFGVVICFIALILGFFLYINRKWCFHSRGRFSCCDEKSLPSNYVHKIGTKHRYDTHTSSDSEEEILRRLRLQQSCSLQSGQLSRYGGGVLSPLNQSLNFNGLQHVSVPLSKSGSSSRDPLAIAERGKVGMAPSSSSSSNSSVEASMESNVGLVDGERKDRKLIASASGTKSPDSMLRETRIDSGVERKNSAGPSSIVKYARSIDQHRDSLDDIPDINSNSNQDCIVVLSQEQMFDTSDLKSLKSDIEFACPVSPAAEPHAFGNVEIALLYDAPMRKMTVHVLQAKDIPTRGQQTHTQVRLLMLPGKKQKHKTKIRSGENPQFMESFLLHRVNPEEVNSMGIRVRVYGCERMRRERLIGEAIVSFATIDLELETNLWLSLEPRANSMLNGSTSDLLSLARSDSTGSTTSSMQHGGVPELLLGLAYNGTTGRLLCEVVKGSHFRNLTLNKAPDTYVKLCLVNSMGQEMARAKSSKRCGQPNPLFKETFIFQVALFQLNDVTLMVSIYAKRNMKRNEMVGWFSLGLNSSGPEEIAHWTDMLTQTRGELLARWHILVDS